MKSNGRRNGMISQLNPQVQKPAIAQTMIAQSVINENTKQPPLSLL